MWNSKISGTFNSCTWDNAICNFMYWWIFDWFPTCRHIVLSRITYEQKPLCAMIYLWCAWYRFLIYCYKMKRRFRYVVQISIETILPAFVRFINRSLPQPAPLSNLNLRMHKYYHALYSFTANDKSNSKKEAILRVENWCSFKSIRLSDYSNDDLLCWRIYASVNQTIIRLVNFCPKLIAKSLSWPILFQYKLNTQRWTSVTFNSPSTNCMEFIPASVYCLTIVLLS